MDKLNLNYFGVFLIVMAAIFLFGATKNDQISLVNKHLVEKEEREITREENRKVELIGCLEGVETGYDTYLSSNEVINEAGVKVYDKYVLAEAAIFKETERNFCLRLHG